MISEKVMVLMRIPNIHPIKGHVGGSWSLSQQAEGGVRGGGGAPWTHQLVIDNCDLNFAEHKAFSAASLIISGSFLLSFVCCFESLCRF